MPVAAYTFVPAPVPVLVAVPRARRVRVELTVALLSARCVVEAAAGLSAVHPACLDLGCH